MATKKICDMCEKDITLLRACDQQPTTVGMRLPGSGYRTPEVSVRVHTPYDFCQTCRREVEILAAKALLTQVKELQKRLEG